MFESRWYQAECELALYEYFSNKTGNPICALPTGTGKSVVIAQFIKNALFQWPNQRMMMITHDKNLIDQNAEKLKTIWPEAPLGIFSAGLREKNSRAAIVFGGVQSIAKEIKRESARNDIPPQLLHFGWRDLIIVDECHLISPEENSAYQYIIKELKSINPYLKIIGFSATPYRLKQGLLTDEGIFTDFCYDITGIEAFNRLIAEGYLAPLIPKKTGIEINLAGVGIVAGDFNSKELEAAVDKEEVIYNAVKETVEYGHDRKKWLVFATGVESAEHIASMFQSFGIEALATHSKLSSAENDKRLNDFKHGDLRVIVNNNKLTTGFDCPQIDLISMLRPTQSPGLWVQMLGRGTRPCEGKTNCLVLDFAGNTRRLGPINDPVKPRRRGKGEPGEAPIRICDNCGVYNHASARYCIHCGVEFAFNTKLFNTASEAELIKNEIPEIKVFDVIKVLYNLHEKDGSPPSIKVSYFCGFQMFSEWVCLEHSGFAGKKARDWWVQRHLQQPPSTTAEALKITSLLRMPKSIRVLANKKHPEVIGYEF